MAGHVLPDNATVHATYYEVYNPGSHCNINRHSDRAAVYIGSHITTRCSTHKLLSNSVLRTNDITFSMAHCWTGHVCPDNTTVRAANCGVSNPGSHCNPNRYSDRAADDAPFYEAVISCAFCQPNTETKRVIPDCSTIVHTYQHPTIVGSYYHTHRPTH